MANLSLPQLIQLLATVQNNPLAGFREQQVRQQVGPLQALYPQARGIQQPAVVEPAATLSRGITRPEGQVPAEDFRNPALIRLLMGAMSGLPQQQRPAGGGPLDLLAGGSSPETFEALRRATARPTLTPRAGQGEEPPRPAPKRAVPGDIEPLAVEQRGFEGAPLTEATAPERPEAQGGGVGGVLRRILPFLAGAAGTGLAAAVGGPNFRRGLAGGLTQLGPNIGARAQEERERQEREEVRAETKAYRDRALSIQELGAMADMAGALSKMQGGDFSAVQALLSKVGDPKQRFDTFTAMVPADMRSRFAAQFPTFPVGNPSALAEADKRKYESEQAEAFSRDPNVQRHERQYASYKALTDLLESGKTGVEHFAVMWNFIKSMDDTAVREGEVSSFLGTLPIGQRLLLWLTGERPFEGKFLPAEALDAIRRAATKSMQNSVAVFGQHRQAALRGVANVTGTANEALFPNYSADFAQTAQPAKSPYEDERARNQKRIEDIERRLHEE